MKLVVFNLLQLLLLVSSISAWEPVIRVSDNPQYAYEVTVDDVTLLRISSFARTQPNSATSCLDDVTSLASVDEMGAGEREWLERMIDTSSLNDDPASPTINNSIARNGIWIGSGKSRRRRDKERCYALKKIEGSWRKVLSPCHFHKHFVCKSNHHKCLSSKLAFDEEVNSFKVYYQTPMCAKAEEMRMLSNFPNAFIQVNETENSMHFHFSSTQNYQTMLKRHSDGMMVNLTGTSGWIQWDENYEYQVPIETGSYPDFEYAYDQMEYDFGEYGEKEEEEEEEWVPLIQASFDEYLQELRADLSAGERLPEDLMKIQNYLHHYFLNKNEEDNDNQDKELEVEAPTLNPISDTDDQVEYDLGDYGGEEKEEEDSGSGSEEEEWVPLIQASFDEYLQELRADLSAGERLPEDLMQVRNYFQRYIYGDERFQHHTEDESADSSVENEEKDDDIQDQEMRGVSKRKEPDEEKVVDNQERDGDVKFGRSKKLTTVIILIVATTVILLVVLYRFRKRTTRSYEKNQILPIVVDRYPEKDDSEWPSNWTGRKKTGPKRNLHSFLNKIKLGLSRSDVEQSTLPTHDSPAKSASLQTV